MTTGQRSRNGCWTCRLRRKKCDETRPVCTTCDSLGITCHGYGPRPDWMDGGENEKRVAAETRRDIKTASRREPRPGSISRNGGLASPASEPHVRQTPASSDGEGFDRRDSVISPARHSEPITLKKTSPTPSITYPTPSITSLVTREEPFRHKTFSISSTPKTESPDYGLSNTIQGRETSLLMYYLDYVFFLQFRLYSPLIADGGRGWLLSLLLRTPPLYHMTLAISAHCLWLLRQNQDNQEQNKEEVEGFRASLAQVDLALHEMQEYIRDFSSQDGRGSLDDNIKACASIAQMLAYSVFTGKSNDWFIHLKGASSCASVLIEALFTLPTLSHVPFTVDLSSDILSKKEREASIKFLVGTYAWMDICATTCTGKAPIFEELYDRLLDNEERWLNMSKLNGIENGVLLLISKISSLYAWKREAKAEGKLSMIELVSRATRIETELNERLSTTSKVPSPAVLSPEDAVYIPLANLWPYQRFVTRMYASAALTYLHVVVSGPHPELREIRSSVMNSITTLKEMPEPMLVRTIYWPIFITGSMAVKEEEDMFRNLMTTAGITAGSMGSGWNMLQILEQCWRTRDVQDFDTGDGYWVNVMASIGERILVL